MEPLPLTWEDLVSSIENLKKIHEPLTFFVSRWIPVGIWLPEHLETTLVLFINDDVDYLCYAGKDELGPYWLSDEDNTHRFYPTHWMPKPPPPPRREIE